MSYFITCVDRKTYSIDEVYDSDVKIKKVSQNRN